MFFRIDVFNSFTNFTGKHQCWSLFLIKLQAYYEKEVPTEVLSCEISELFKNTFYKTTPLLAAFEQTKEISVVGIFRSFSISLPWLSNIMLNSLTKSSLDISLLFKLKYAAISLILWTVNKPCYNNSLCLHEYTKMIGLKRKQHLLAEKKLK